jgi:hypothetical protein
MKESRKLLSQAISEKGKPILVDQEGQKISEESLSFGIKSKKMENGKEI